MFWSAFLGGLAGTVVCFLLFVVVAVIWDQLDQRRKVYNQAAAAQEKQSFNVERFLESHLEEILVSNFSRHFPTLTIYPSDSSTNDKHKGVRFRTPAGEIDILCVDEDGNFVIIELKREKAPDTVVTQVTRYINWVRESLAIDGQAVRALIIAKSFDRRLWYALTSREDIDALVYDWHLNLKRFTPPYDQPEASINSSLATAHSFGVGE